MAFPSTPTDQQLYTTADGRVYKYTLASDSWGYQSVQPSGIKNNNAASANPTVTDDTNSGYSPGSVWTNVAAQTAFINMSAASGAAVWNQLTANIIVSAAAPASPATGQQYLNTTSGFVFVWNGSAWVDVTAAGSSTKNNFAATTAPGTANDSSVLQGYAVGSVWIDTTANLSYTCVDSTIGAAIWSAGGGTTGATATVAAVAPTTPVSGDIWFDTTTNTTYLWDGTVWANVAASSATVAAVAPTTPASGDIWFDTVNTVTYLWDGTAWIDVTAASGSAGSAATVAAVAPTTPATGDIWFDTANSVTYLWDGTAWIDVTAAAGGTAPKNNFAAVAAPGATNDSSVAQGYSVGSQWVDNTTKFTYMCVTSTIGAAVWNRTS